MQATQVEKRKKSWKREALEWGLTFLIALAIALPVRAFVFSPYIVQGHSMMDTLTDRETMFATKYDYLLGDPARFDVVICRYPGRSETFVKRVAGIPGDTVAVQDGYLYVNGDRYEETYITRRPNYRMEAYTLQEDEYFVLGDNRANSNDSHLVGPIQRKQIIAHVRFVLYPFDRIRGIQ